MTTPISDGICVCREQELERLDDYLQQAASGRGSICFVTGEPGAGKSTLLNEFVRRSAADHPDLVIAMGDCNPQTGTADAYLPFREILSELATDPEDGESASGRAHSFLAAAGRMLTEHGPDLIDLFVPGGAIVTRVGAQAAGRIRGRSRAGASTESADRAPQDSRLEQNHVFEQYTNVIRKLSEQHPLLLMIDDLHWADEASIGLLFHLSRRLEGHRVLLIGAYRATEVSTGRDGERHPLESWLNELKRYQGDIWIDLARSQESLGRQFVDELLDTEPNRFSRSFRDKFYAQTGGHALFAAELLRHLKDREFVAAGEDGVWVEADEVSWEGLPARVEGVISERTARLSNEEQELMTAASVLGESFHAEVLAGVLEMEKRDIIRRLSGSLAKKHGLVRALGADRAAGKRLSLYEFRHQLFHRFFYESLDPVERGMLHEDAAAVLLDLFGDEAASAAVQLAHHYSAAELHEEAVEYLFLAGREAQRKVANAEARSYYRAALDGLGRIQGDSGDLPERWRQTRQSVRAALGDVLLLDGEFSAARELFETALDASPPDDRLEQTRLLIRVARSHEREHRHDKALDLLEQADARLGVAAGQASESERNEWLNIRVSRLWLCYWKGDVDGMARVIEEAGSVVEEHGSPTQKRAYFSGLAAFRNRRDRFVPSAETLESANRAMQAALASDKMVDRADGVFGAAFIYMLHNDFDHAEELMKQSFELAGRSGDRTLQARCLTYLAVLNRRKGRTEEMRAYGSRALEVCQALGMEEYVAVIDACESWLALGQNDEDKAEKQALAALDKWEERAPRYPFKWLALFPLLQIAMNRQSEIEPMIGHARALLDPVLSGFAGTIETVLADAVSAFEAGDSEQARSLLRQALGEAGQSGYL